MYNQILKCEEWTLQPKALLYFLESILTEDSPPSVEHQVDSVVVTRARDLLQLRGLDHRSLGVIVGVISRPRGISDVNTRLSSGQKLVLQLLTLFLESAHQLLDDNPDIWKSTKNVS